MTFAAYKGRCHTCGHDSSDDDLSAVLAIKTAPPVRPEGAGGIAALDGEVVAARALFDAVQEYILCDNLRQSASASAVISAINKYRRIALTARATPEPSCEWTQDVPTRQDTYWHWDGDEDSAPLPYHVLWSGTSNKCFVSYGQYGLDRAIDCDEFGGWWLPCPTPKTPEVER